MVRRIEHVDLAALQAGRIQAVAAGQGEAKQAAMGKAPLLRHKQIALNQRRVHRGRRHLIRLVKEGSRTQNREHHRQIKPHCHAGTIEPAARRRYIVTARDQHRVQRTDQAERQCQGQLEVPVDPGDHQRHRKITPEQTRAIDVEKHERLQHDTQQHSQPEAGFPG